MNGVANALADSLLHKAAGAMLVEARATAWCSATFAGARHVIVLALPDAEAVARLCDGLEDHEFGLVGGFVADIHADAPREYDDGLHVSVDALTIETD